MQMAEVLEEFKSFGFGKHWFPDGHMHCSRDGCKIPSFARYLSPGEVLALNAEFPGNVRLGMALGRDVAKFILANFVGTPWCTVHAPDSRFKKYLRQPR